MSISLCFGRQPAISNVALLLLHLLLVCGSLQWVSDTFSDTLVGFANSIKTIDGGSHLDGLKAALTRLINAAAKRNKVGRHALRHALFHALRLQQTTERLKDTVTMCAGLDTS